jgi:hypothetical protein
MKKGFIPILVILGLTAISAMTAIGVFKYMPLSWLQSEQKFGTTLTAITGSTKVSDLDTILTTNFNALNAGKIEVSTTTLPFITTLTNLTSVGALASGSLTTGFTAVPVALGGTGTTSPSLNQVMLGNTTSGFKTVSGYGTTGQFLTSAGAGSVPTWTTSAVDQTIDYIWTGGHYFNSASSTFYGFLNLPYITATSTVNHSTLPFASSTAISAGNATFSGTASTTNLYLSGTLYSIGIYSTSSLAKTGSATQNDITSVIAYCTSGYKVISGGFIQVKNASEDEEVIKSYPDSSTSWTAAIRCVGSSCTADTIQAYAICLKIQ